MEPDPGARDPGRRSGGPCLCALAPLLLFASLPGEGAVAWSHGEADTVPPAAVDAFHGYPWGTRASEIAEIDPGSEPAAAAGGQRVYSGSLNFLGMPTRAFFYVEGDGGLRMGKYQARPPSESCTALFRTFRLMLAGSHPALLQRVRRGTGAEELGREGAGDVSSRRVACRRFLEAGEVTPWEVAFRNPASGRTEIRLRMVRPDGRAGILACYLMADDCRWSAGGAQPK